MRVTGLNADGDSSACGRSDRESRAIDGRPPHGASVGIGFELGRITGRKVARLVEIDDPHEVRRRRRKV